MADQEKKLVYRLMGDDSHLKGVLGSVGGMLAGAFAIGTITKFTGAVAKVGMEFEQQMARVHAISGATQEEFEALKAEAERLGAATVFSSAEAAKGLEYFAMAGWKADDAIAALEPTLQLAIASGEELGTVADIVSDAMTAFGMEASRANDFTDLLAATATNSNTNVSMLGESFKYVAPVIGAMGGEAEHTAFALGLMANAGIKGSMAGTALKTALTNMVTGAGAAGDAMAALGLQVTFADDGSLALDATLGNLRNVFSTLTKEEQASYAAMIFGKEAMAGMLSIINASETDWNKLSEATQNYNGKAQEMADIMGNTLNGRVEALKSAWEGVQLMLYKFLLPVFEMVVLGLQTLLDWVMQLETVVKDKFSGISIAGEELGAGFTEIKDKLVEIFKKIVETVNQWYENNKERIDAVVEKFKEFWKGVSEVINLVLDIIKMFIDVFTLYFLDKGLIIIETFLGAFKGIVEVIKGVLKIIKGLFTGDWALIWEGAKNIFSGVWTTIQAVFKGAINFIINKLNAFIRGINKIKIPDWVPVIGGRGIKIPTIPLLAEGGIVTRETLAMIGEGSEPEAVLPLSKLDSLIGSGGGSANIIVELDGQTIARAIGEPLVNQIRVRTGLAI